MIGDAFRLIKTGNALKMRPIGSFRERRALIYHGANPNFPSYPADQLTEAGVDYICVKNIRFAHGPNETVPGLQPHYIVMVLDESDPDSPTMLMAINPMSDDAAENCQLDTDIHPGAYHANY